MKVRTSELDGAALNWAAAKADGMDWGSHRVPDYCNDWDSGGPIIEQARITVIAMPNGSWATSTPLHSFHHPTPLVAAMRCFVASKLGDEVEVPDELVK